MDVNDTLTVGRALEVFLGHEHLTDEAYTKPVNYVSVGPLRIPFPNPKLRREIVYLHDINHLLSGYDTSWVGEGEVSAWELATGFPRECWIGYIYAPQTLIVGLLLNPLRVFRAYLRGRRQKNACHAHLTKATIMEMTVGELKRHLGHSNSYVAVAN